MLPCHISDHHLSFWMNLHLWSPPPINLDISKIGQAMKVMKLLPSTMTFELLNFLPVFFRVPVNETLSPAWLGHRSLGHEINQIFIARKCGTDFRMSLNLGQIMSSSAKSKFGAAALTLDGFLRSRIPCHVIHRRVPWGD